MVFLNYDVWTRERIRQSANTLIRFNLHFSRRGDFNAPPRA